MGALEVERAALGAVLVNPQSWHVVATLSRDDFLLDSHRKIFGRMSHLAESLRPIGLVTIVNELDCHRELQVVGGAGYVASLMDGLPDRPLSPLNTTWTKSSDTRGCAIFCTPQTRYEDKPTAIQQRRLQG